MKGRRKMISGAALLAFLAALWPGSGIVAGGPEEELALEGELPLVVTVPHQISYQGRLTDQSGNPLDGSYDMVFRLWDAASAGSQIGSDIPRNKVPVSNGFFSVALDADPGAFNGQALWLEIEVNSQLLSPRQQLLAVPYAWCALGGLGFPFEGSDNTASGSSFAITNVAAGGTAVRGTGDGVGVVGEATGSQGKGVLGVANGAAAYGVQGYNAADGHGVFGVSEQGVGGFFRCKDNTQPDIELSGPEGWISSDRLCQSSLLLQSNDWVVVRLDQDGLGGNGVFVVRDTDNQDLFTVHENGTATATTKGPGFSAIRGIADGTDCVAVYGVASGSGTIAVKGESASGPGGYFKNGNIYAPDIQLDGPYGTIGSDPNDRTSQIYLMSNHHVVVRLDTDNNGLGIFMVKNDRNSEVFTVNEKGTLTLLSESGAVLVEMGEGLDYAEGFNVSAKAEISPGTVLVIDPENPGKLAISDKAYDRKVAGIVTGAKGLKSGVRLGTKQFDCDVALAGRVYCNVDSTYGRVAPGDLLTTSATPGYAMVVKGHPKAQGAILGKAMEGLAEGQKGQILVLVALQ